MAGGHPLETEPTDDATLEALRREIDELRASRARLALAADAERRSIERALHEGVLQDLVGLAATLEVAADALGTDPEAARTTLDELRGEARRALTDVRELATRVYPPLLDVGGLVAELRAAASRAGVQARIDVDGARTAPPGVVAAVYLCALDVFERAPDGASVVVRVRGEADAVAFGIDAEADLGSEPRVAYDRIEALGGDVTVTAGSDRTTVVGSLQVPR